MNRTEQLSLWLQQETGLDEKSIDIDSPLAELGLNSTTVYRLAGRISREIGFEVSPTLFFKHPTLRELSLALEREMSGQASENHTLRANDLQACGLQGRVYVVGMACRFPGVSNISEYDRLLRAGTCTVKELPEDRKVLSPTLAFAEASSTNQGYWRGGYIDDVDGFDPKAFRISPKEAPEMDPQQRLILMACRDALEDAGLIADLATNGERVGVFIGASSSDYAILSLQASKGNPSPYFGTGNAHSILSGRLSYLFGWNGPSLTIDTACSSSLVALHLAKQSILTGECDIAVVGGVNLILDPSQTQVFAKAGMLSPEGLCRTFDSRASGYVRGEGVGVVILATDASVAKYRLDPYAVVCGSSVNQDGRSNGLTAPHGPSQVAVMRSALRNANLSAENVVAIEAHGTGTRLGDPIEWDSLNQVYGHEGSGPCFVSSVKSNFGHLESAAGIAGLMRVCLSLKNRFIPAHLHFESPLEIIGQLGEGSRLRIPKETQSLSAMDSSRPLFMGVSSFGFGGTSAHVILGEARLIMPAEEVPPESHFPPFLAVSASQPHLAQNLAQSIVEASRELNPIRMGIEDAAASLLYGRHASVFRTAIVQDGQERGDTGLSHFMEPIQAGELFPVGLFTGQGSQRPGQGYMLYDSHDQIRSFMNECDLILEDELEGSLLDVMFNEAESSLIHQTKWTQPALFVFEAAQFEYWKCQGFEPELLVGHSVGEVVAAYAAGILSLENALRLVARRGRLMQEAPAGGKMFAVSSSPNDIAEELSHFSPRIVLAAWNAPKSCVVSGDSASLVSFCERLTERSIKWKQLQVSHAFHSPHMSQASLRLSDEISQLNFNAAKIPILSNVSGDFDQGAMSTAEYWSKQILSPTLFYPSLSKIYEMASKQSPKKRLFALEYGPSAHLIASVKSESVRHDLGTKVPKVISVCPKGVSETQGMTRVAAALWCHSGHLSRPDDFVSRQGLRIHLPTTPFDRSRFWIKVNASTESPSTSVAHDFQIPKKNSDDNPLERGLAPMSDGLTKSQRQLKAIQHTVQGIVCEALGIKDGNVDPSASLLEVGADSLLLVDAVRSLEETYGLEFSMSDLFGDLSSVSALSMHILTNAKKIPEVDSMERPFTEAFDADNRGQFPKALARSVEENLRRRTENAAPTLNAQTLVETSVSVSDGAGHNALHVLLRSQLGIMEKQLELLRHVPREVETVSQKEELTSIDLAQQKIDRRSIQLTHWDTERRSHSAREQSAKATVRGSSAPADEDRFSAMMPKLSTTAGDQNLAEYLGSFIPKFVLRTKKSRDLAQDFRKPLAENRNASGFRMHLKELCYPIAASSSKGARIWDVDGNEYIDMTMGFGVNLFGHSDPDIQAALVSQLERGIQVGPQSDQAGLVAQAFTQLTGQDRVAFTNSGTEAVMTAIRLARAATGRDRIVIFAHSYHGTFDGVLARATRASTKGEPVTKGIPSSLVSDVDVLDYGSEAALEFIRANGHNLACVLVEPIQSRRPGLQPKEFLLELRRLTLSTGCALIFDEVITGLRTGPTGAQGFFGVQADIATYGKVLGGGLPIGAVAGKAAFLDPIDGGFWRYGDDSYPKTDLTFFAGTFCKHPLAMAAASCVLKKISSDPGVCERLNEKTAALCDRLNRHFDAEFLPLRLDHFGSLFRFSFSGNLDVLFYELVYRGIYVWEGRNLFLSDAHTDQDIARFEDTVKAILSDLSHAGVLKKKE